MNHIPCKIAKFVRFAKTPILYPIPLHSNTTIYEKTKYKKEPSVLTLNALKTIRLILKLEGRFIYSRSHTKKNVNIGGWMNSLFVTNVMWLVMFLTALTFCKAYCPYCNPIKQDLPRQVYPIAFKKKHFLSPFGFVYFRSKWKLKAHEFLFDGWFVWTQIGFSVKVTTFAFYLLITLVLVPNPRSISAV